MAQAPKRFVATAKKIQTERTSHKLQLLVSHREEPANPIGAAGAVRYHEVKAAAKATEAPIPRTTTAPTRQPMAALDSLHGQHTPRLAK